MGKAAAAELVRCGAKVVLAGRREDVLDAASREMGQGSSWVTGDIRERQEAEGIVRAVLQRLGLVEEYGWLVALLASPFGETLSGSVVTLDGALDNWFGPWPPESLAADGGVPTEARHPPSV